MATGDLCTSARALPNVKVGARWKVEPFCPKLVNFPEASLLDILDHMYECEKNSGSITHSYGGQAWASNRHVYHWSIGKARMGQVVNGTWAAPWNNRWQKTVFVWLFSKTGQDNAWRKEWARAESKGASLLPHYKSSHTHIGFTLESWIWTSYTLDCTTESSLNIDTTSSTIYDRFW